MRQSDEVSAMLFAVQLREYVVSLWVLQNTTAHLRHWRESGRCGCVFYRRRIRISEENFLLSEAAEGGNLDRAML
jgi:hypothetical protein